MTWILGTPEPPGALSLSLSLFQSIGCPQTRRTCFYPWSRTFDLDRCSLHRVNRTRPQRTKTRHPIRDRRTNARDPRGHRTENSRSDFPNHPRIPEDRRAESRRAFPGSHYLRELLVGKRDSRVQRDRGSPQLGAAHVRVPFPSFSLSLSLSLCLSIFFIFWSLFFSLSPSFDIRLERR